MQKVDDDDCAVGNKKKFISSWLTTAFSGMSINSSERKSMLHERKSRGHIPHTFRWVLCNHFLETRESCYGHRYCWFLSELYNMKPAVVILFDWWKTLDSKLDTYQTFFGERYVIASPKHVKARKTGRACYGRLYCWRGVSYCKSLWDCGDTAVTTIRRKRH